MRIKWRLVVLVIQLLLLALVTFFVSGRFYSADTWFLAGLLAIIINPQLLEPYYPRPGDVIANSVIFFFLFLNSPKTYTNIGWYIFALIFLSALVLAVIGLVFRDKANSRLAGIGRASRIISQKASAQVIYSVVFVLSLINQFKYSHEFWILVGAWVLLMFFGNTNWQTLWSILSSDITHCKIEGMIGPSTLLLTAPSLPDVGSWVSLSNQSECTTGVVIKRIRRLIDVWGEIHVSDYSKCESIFSGAIIRVQACGEEKKSLVGSVGVGSTDVTLRFISTKSLEIGDVVGVPVDNSGKHISYQLSSAIIERADVKGGAHLTVQAYANQLGVFDCATCYFRRHRWVPPLGSPIFTGEILKIPSDLKIPDDKLILGDVIGTNMPILLDHNLVCEGHLAILGMTKMGKSTLAIRLANGLSKSRKVIILDQTGEYISRHGFPQYDDHTDWTKPGIMVLEPKLGEVPADRALAFLKSLVKIAIEEYKKGAIIPRSIIIDEAHQFIPEPTGLGFSAPGRDSSFNIGLLMMQIRKYGISVILISQRTAVVAKSALSQCENLIAFRSVDQTGLDYLEALAGNSVRSLLPQLRQGEALVFGPAISSDVAVAIRVRQS